jgi:hypothetical protein
MAFLLHFKDDSENYKKNVFFSMYYLLPDLMCFILLDSFQISINFSVSFQMIPRICISFLHGLSYRQLDFGMKF